MTQRQSRVRASARLLLAAVLLASALAPAAALAAPKPHDQAAKGPNFRWEPAYMEKGVVEGATRQLVFTTHFYSRNVVARVVFDTDLGGGLRAQRPQIIPINNLHYYAMSVIVTVPGRLEDGYRKGTVRLFTRNGHDTDALGGPFTFAVRVHAAHHPRVVTAVWTPRTLGQIVINPGQTVTENASFTLSYTATAVQIVRDLSGYAAARGLSVTLLGTTSYATLSPNTPVGVSVSVAASATATPGVYGANLRLLGSANGGAATRLPFALGMAIRVAAPTTTLIAWPSGSPVAYTVTRAANATVSAAQAATFSSTTALAGAVLVGELGPNAVRNGITIVTPALPATIAANTPTSVQFTLNVPQNARPGVYNGLVYLKASLTPGAVPVTLHYGLHFVLAVNK